MPMHDDGYLFTRDDFVQMLARKWFPERTDRESGVIRDYLAAHHHEFDRFTFSKRVGQGVAPDPAHLEGVQRNTVFSSRKRIDILAGSGSHPTLIEVKERVTPASLGQILTYRSLFLEEHPDADEPSLVVIGRESDPDTLAVLQAHGVTVYLYAAADAAGVDAGGAARPVSGPAP
jgi:hypothetical protein